jgi:hypothetical protein
MAKSNLEIVEIENLAVKAAGDYCRAKKITEGMTKKAHAGAMLHALMDAGLIVQTEGEEADVLAANLAIREQVFFTLCALENCSQLRQTLEKAGVLGTKAAIATEYM